MILLKINDYFLRKEVFKKEFWEYYKKNFESFNLNNHYTWGDFPSGHFYSPIPSTNDINFGLLNKEVGTNELLNSISLNKSEMLEIARELLQSAFLYEIQINNKSSLYDPSTALAFGPRDALILYSMIKKFKPRNIFEIGSGESTAIMLDAKNANNLDTKIISIEPYPQYLNEKLGTHLKKIQLLESPVQQIDPKIFLNIQKNDLLFIDSSHVLKIGSDVQFIFNQVLPILPKGALIHFHDIIWPFEYHQTWLKQKIFWNEAYFLRALLTNSNRYEIVLFSSFFEKHLLNQVGVNYPELYKIGDSGSIYLRVKT